ncbi:MAG: hypothetical protein JST93_31945 [Acidobacteria bacterium]|nr:hypothetical protein [Acidobacteriota bacterium]
MSLVTLFVLTACLGAPLGAQAQTEQQGAHPGAIVVSYGYQVTWPTWFMAAPGQVLALTVHGIGSDLKDHVLPKERPLPRELAGIAVELQYGARPGQIFAPLLGLVKVPSCGFSGGPSYCKSTIMIILQVPYDLEILRQEWLSAHRLIVHEKGEPVCELSMSLYPQQPHIVSTEDITRPAYPEFQASVGFQMVKHLDGSWVTQDNPAKPGEELKLYAMGLGIDYMKPRPRSGENSPAGYTVDVGIGFEFGSQTVPSPVANYHPWYESPPMDGLVSASLAEGMVGVYEVRFKVPKTIPPGLRSCLGNPRLSHNLMVNIGYTYILAFSGGGQVFDGAAICVEVP